MYSEFPPVQCEPFPFDSECLGLGGGRILQGHTVFILYSMTDMLYVCVNTCDTSPSHVLLHQHLLYLQDIPPVL